MVDRDGRFLYMNRAFARAAGLAEGRMPRYPGDLVVGEDKGPLADMIRRHSSGQQVGGDLSIRLAGQGDRSEEHTSELQSLMRSSYAVFCLKKKPIQL